MNFHNIRNVGLPKNENDAVPRKFVDDMVKEVEEKINKRKQLIAVHANYCGPLEEGEYPFKFSGSNFENCEEIIGEERYSKHIKSTLNGFVMPHTGRIKKIICEGLTYIEKNKIFDKLITLFNEEQIKELKKYFGKEDFKNDLLEKIKNTVDFTTDKINERPLQKGKIIFEITKSVKSFTSRDRVYVFLPQIELKSFTMIRNFEWREIEIGSSINELRAIMQIKNVEDNLIFKEGETLNIKISDFKKNFFETGELIDNILKPIVIFLLGTLNFNFTFLIELDPL